MALERQTGGTEYGWCRAIPGGTTVMAILLSRPPEPGRLEKALRRIQSRHPLLLARLQWADGNPILSISPTPYLSVEVIDSDATLAVLQSSDAGELFHALLEHELNRNSWPETRIETPAALFFPTIYRLPDSRTVLALRLHTAICDRVSAVAILYDFRRMYVGEAAAAETAGEGVGQNGNEKAGEVPGATGTLVLASWPMNSSVASVGEQPLFSEFNLMSGTSTACPHASGVASLFEATHSDWSGAAIRYAMMTTADVLDNTESSIASITRDAQLATPLDMGSGQLNPSKAMDPGLVYDISRQNYSVV